MTTLVPRPSKTRSTTYRQVTPSGKAFVHVASHGGTPINVMVNVGKCGDEARAFAEALGRLLSLLLQLKELGTPEERLRLAADQLAGIGAEGATGFGPGRVSSLPDGIARALREHLEGMKRGNIDDFG